MIAAGAQKEINDAVELGAPARYVPSIIVKFMLPAPSRDTAAAA